jgi:hypothetical protein
MRLNNRVTKLENQMAPKKLHAFGYIVGKQTEQEAVEAYCNKNRFDPERFMNEEYGKVIIIERKLVSPGEIKNGD